MWRDSLNINDLTLFLESRKFNTFLFLLFSMTSTFYIVMLGMRTMISGWHYSPFYFIFFYSRKCIIPILLACYFYLKITDMPKLRSLFDRVAWLSIGFVVLILLPVAVFYELSGTRWLVFDSLRVWSFTAVIEWISYIAIAFLLFNRKMVFPFKAFILAVASAQATGLLYELPIYNPVTNPEGSWFYHPSNPLFISQNIFSLIVYSCFLYFNHWKPRKLFLIVTPIFLGFSMLYALDPGGFMFCNWLKGWLPRLPAQAFMLSTAIYYRGDEP